ncbi:hypothetical protein SGPA1_30356 [Streptomyces misionensis JCM 4497]
MPAPRSAQSRSGRGPVITCAGNGLQADVWRSNSDGPRAQRASRMHGGAGPLGDRLCPGKDPDLHVRLSLAQACIQTSRFKTGRRPHRRGRGPGCRVADDHGVGPRGVWHLGSTTPYRIAQHSLPGRGPTDLRDRRHQWLPEQHRHQYLDHHDQPCRRRRLR